MATVRWHLDELSGATLTLRLYPQTSGSIANGAGGDAMTESGDGLFSATVAESLTGWHKAYADRSSVPVATGWVNMSDASPVVVETPASTDVSPGARTVTITVDDGTDPLEAARVRLTQGAESYVQSTDASGVVTFNLDDATWTVSITKAGYSFAGASLVVNGTETQTYSMTEVVVTPPTNPGLSAIEVLCLNNAGQPESGVAVDIRIVSIPSGSQNIAFKGTKQTATSDGDGIARFEVVQGSTCEWKRGLADVWQKVVIDSDGVTNVTSVIGSP